MRNYYSFNENYDNSLLLINEIALICYTNKFIFIRFAQWYIYTPHDVTIEVSNALFAVLMVMQYFFYLLILRILPFYFIFEQIINNSLI